MAESGNSFVGADTSIYNRLMQPAQPVDPMGQAAKVVEFQRQSNALDMSQLDKHAQHLQFIAGQIAPLVQLGKDVTPDQITKQVMDTVTSSGGKVSPDEATQFLSRVMTYPGGPAAGLQATQIQVLDGLNRIATMRGNTQATGTGGGTQYSQQNAFTGAMAPTPGGYIPNTQSVSERMTTQGRVIPDGRGGYQAVAVPNGVAYDQYGNLRQGGAAPAAPAATPATPRPATVVAQPAAPAPSATAASMAPNGFIPTAAPMGAQIATEATATQSAAQGNQLQTLAAGVPDRKAKLAQLEQLLNQTTTGPAAPTMAKAGALANELLAMGGSSYRIPGTADKEEIMKVVGQLAADQSAALGGTDASKALAAHINPNASFSTEGNRQIITMLKGQEDAIAAKNSAWQDYKKGNGAADYGTFQEQFNKNFAPRAFQLPYMSQDERAKTIASMSPQERAQVRAAYNAAVEKGYIKPGGQ